MNVELLGVNRNTDAAYNSLIAATISLPWLQDTVQDNVWSRWQVIYRDVRILDSQNRVRAVFNLTDYNLALEPNRASLKRLLLDAAKVVDSDADRLPDDWELQYFGNLAANPHGDPDGDGDDNLTEFAFGTNPADPTSRVPLKMSLIGPANQRVLSVSFRRRAGGLLDYFVETSPDLNGWSAASPDLLQEQAPRLLFDGTGTAETSYSVAVAPLSRGFLRVRAAPRQ